MPVTTKAERLEVRLSAPAKSLITQAAQLRHTSVSEFMLSSAVAAAEDVLAMPRVFYANEEAWAQIMRMLEEPPEPFPQEVIDRLQAARLRS